MRYQDVINSVPKWRLWLIDKLAWLLQIHVKVGGYPFGAIGERAIYPVEPEPDVDPTNL